jgi:hypothetical protein
MNANLNSFNYWIDSARQQLVNLARYPSAEVRRPFLDMALFDVGQALKAAEWMPCEARQALCRRIMNWIRADMRRAA